MHPNNVTKKKFNKLRQSIQARIEGMALSRRVSDRERDGEKESAREKMIISFWGDNDSNLVSNRNWDATQVLQVNSGSPQENKVQTQGGR